MSWLTARWSLYAPIYDFFIRAFTRPARRRSLALLALRPGERVAVLGCGTGLDLPFIAPDQPGVALDLTPAMVDRARRNHPRHALDIRTGDAYATGLPAQSVDAVVLHLILAVVPEPEKVLAEAHRILKPGGRLAVFDKGLAHGQRPGLARKLLNPLIEPLATALHVPLESLANQAGFKTIHKEPAIAGLFWVMNFEMQAPNS